MLDERFPTNTRKSPKNALKPPPPATARERRAATYAKAQDLYNKNRSLLADNIFAGKSLLEQEEVYPDINGLRPFIVASSKRTRSLMMLQSPPYRLRPLAFIYLQPVLISRMPITIPAVKKCHILLLEVLFNVVLYRKLTPTSWRTSRTILIPKEGDRPKPL